MNPYEQIIYLMREQGEKDNHTIQIGKMKDEETCIIGELELLKEDLLIAEHLKLGYYSQEQEKQVFIKPLQPGDMVAVYRENEERYIILERLVEI